MFVIYVGVNLQIRKHSSDRLNRPLICKIMRLEKIKTLFLK